MVNRNVMLACLLIAASTRVVGQEFCESIRLLVQASYSDFNAIKRDITRHRDGATDWTPTIVVPGSQDCEGQSDPTISSTVSCTIMESSSEEQVATAYREMVSKIRSCLNRSFVYEETEGGKPSRLSTPIKEASFEVKGKDDNPDGPAVRVSFAQFHRKTRSGYELTVWVDAKEKE